MPPLRRGGDRAGLNVSSNEVEEALGEPREWPLNVPPFWGLSPKKRCVGFRDGPADKFLKIFAPNARRADAQIFGDTIQAWRPDLEPPEQICKGVLLGKWCNWHRKDALGILEEIRFLLAIGEAAPNCKGVAFCMWQRDVLVAVQPICQGMLEVTE
jgi:hypothetical protein